MEIKITEQLLGEIAEKYCTDHTPLSKLAKEYGVSKTTLVRYFNGKGSFKLDPVTQAKVDIVKKDNWIDGKSTNGNLGYTMLTDEEVITLATFMVENELTLEELVSENTPVKSRLFGLFTEEKLGSELYQKVLLQYEKNRHRTFDEYNENRRGNK